MRQSVPRSRKALHNGNGLILTHVIKIDKYIGVLYPHRIDYSRLVV